MLLQNWNNLVLSQAMPSTMTVKFQISSYAFTSQNRDIRTLFYLLTNQRSHSLVYIIDLFFIQSYSNRSNKSCNSARLPALTTFTLHYRVLLSEEPETQNTVFYICVLISQGILSVFNQEFKRERRGYLYCLEKSLVNCYVVLQVYLLFYKSLWRLYWLLTLRPSLGRWNKLAGTIQ